MENDLISAVILLPENLFYNATSAGIILVLEKEKSQERRDKVLLINASRLYEKGRPKNYLPDWAIDKIYEIYRDFKEEEGVSKIATREEIARNDYNLSPSRYVLVNGEDDALPLDEAVVVLREAIEEEREAEEKLLEILQSLGLEV